MSPEELKEAEKMLQAIKKGVKPPPCRGKDECDVYCSEPDHFEECITFSEAAGLMSPKELEESKKMLDAIKKGIKPPACSGKEECDRYCEMPEHQEECFKFAKEAGFIPEEDLRQIEEGRQRFLEGYNMASLEVKQCLEERLGSGVIQKIISGEGILRREMGDTMKACFEEFPPSFEGGAMHRGGGPGAGFGGPEVRFDREKMIGVRVEKGPLGLVVLMTAPEGIKSFAILPQEGSRYSGQLPACQREFRAETPFQENSYPLQLVIKSCQGEEYQFSIDHLGEYSRRIEGEIENEFEREPLEREGYIPPLNQGPGPGFESGLELEVPQYELPPFEKFPPEVVECIKSSVGGAERFEKIKSREELPNQNFGEIIDSCFKSYFPQGEFPKPEDKMFESEERSEGMEREMMEGRIEDGREMAPPMEERPEEQMIGKELPLGQPGEMMEMMMPTATEGPMEPMEEMMQKMMPTQMQMEQQEITPDKFMDEQMMEGPMPPIPGEFEMPSGTVPEEQPQLPLKTGGLKEFLFAIINLVF
jgi:hypothetical protein